MSTVFLLRFGAELYELKTNVELARYVRWTATVDDQYDDLTGEEPNDGELHFDDCNLTPAFEGMLVREDKELPFRLTWPSQYPFRPPIVRFEDMSPGPPIFDGSVVDAMIREQWSPALMTHQWLLMLFTKP